MVNVSSLPMKFRVFIFLAAVFVAGSGVASGQSGGVTQINLSLLLSASPLRESPFFHSVPVGTSSGTVLRLSLGEAIERGLSQNLGILQREQAVGFERGRRWKELSGL